MTGVPPRTTPDLELDCRTMRCPLPVIELARHLTDVEEGGLIAVVTLDAAARVDVPAWCRMKRQEYAGEDLADDGAPRFWVRRVAPDGAGLSPRARPEHRRRMATDDSCAPPAEPFAIAHAPEALDDLRRRLLATRWPGHSPAPAWQQGTDLDYLVELVDYWAGGFDWAKQQRWLNGFPHYRARVDETTIHFVHVRAAQRDGIPLVLTHGWPSCFVEYLPIIPLLTDPAAHGLDGPAFDVVVPSLPGYAYSERPDRAGFTTRDTARLWHRLMQRLGYPRYGAHGTDFGSAVTSFLALDQPDSVLGIHLSNLDLFPRIGEGTPSLSDAERAYLAQYQRWADDDRGYGVIQSTRPQTVGYGLTDSPAGLAAWVLEKWRAWSDCGGDLESRFSRDFLLTVVTLYWLTGTITSSLRDYVDNRDVSELLGPTDRVRVPTAVAVFAHQFIDDGEPPREWAERLYDVRRWTTMPSGGHFAAAEEPILLARDLGAFFAGL